MTAPILILGASGGIGASLARRLHARGQPLHLAARKSDDLAALGRELSAPVSTLDVLDEKELEATVRVAGQDGALGGLAYCIGSIVIKPLARSSAEDFLDAFRLNTVGAALAVRAAAPALKKARGAVVLFSTVAVQQGFGNHAVIAAAKGGVEGLARSLAAELAPAVRVNCIAPSLVQTPLAAPLLSNPKVAEGIAAMHPLGRLGEPEDVAALADLLLAPDSGWISGQVIGVDGGRSSLRTPH